MPDMTGQKQYFPLGLVIVVAIFLSIVFDIGFVLVARENTEVAKSITGFLESLIGTISLGMAFALFIGAINAFAIQSRIEKVLENANREKNALAVERARASLLFQHIPTTLGLLTNALNTSGKSLGDIQIEIMWERKFIMVLCAECDQDRLNECRDIIGSMEFSRKTSKTILLQTTDILSSMLTQEKFDALERDDIDTRKNTIRKLLRLGYDILDNKC